MIKKHLIVSRKQVNSDTQKPLLIWVDVCNISLNLGICYEKGRGIQQNPEKAIEYYQQCVALYTELGPKYLLTASDIYAALDNIYSALDQPEESFECLKKIIALYAQAKKEDEYLVNAWIRLMNYQLSRGQYQETLEACQTAERLANKFFETVELLQSDIYPAYVKVYSAFGNTSKAAEYQAKCAWP